MQSPESAKESRFQPSSRLHALLLGNIASCARQENRIYMRSPELRLGRASRGEFSQSFDVQDMFFGWVSRSAGRYADGQVGRWAGGYVRRYAGVQVGRWAGGQVNRQAGKYAGAGRSACG